LLCHFSFVENPSLEYNAIYSADYYAGKGADPLVDYEFELEHPLISVRQYEWRGILQVIKSLMVLESQTQWLDFGCGNGGLVRYVREHEPCQIVGFEEGWIREKALAMTIPLLERGQLNDCSGAFDIVTAIEVLEHVVEPLQVLAQIRRLLKPGGLFFFTTGNAEPFRGRLSKWQYVIPEIHVSFFEPATMAHALTQVGFRPEFRGFLPGFVDILRFKILKNLHVRQISLLEQVLPWSFLTRIANSQLKITAHCIGWADDRLES